MSGVGTASVRGCNRGVGLQGLLFVFYLSLGYGRSVAVCGCADGPFSLNSSDTCERSELHT